MSSTENGATSAADSDGVLYRDPIIYRRTFPETAFMLILAFQILGLLYFLLSQPTYTTSGFFNSYSPESLRVPEINVFPETTDMMELKNMLRKAAMNINKTVIITTLNAAWTSTGSIFDLFLESFKSGIQTQHLLNHMVIVALDETAYARCTESNLLCYALKTDGVDFSGEKVHMTPDYLKLVWRRNEFIITVLELGYNLVFTDADVMWLRNPFPHFFMEGDIQFSCDYYSHNSTDRRNSPNAGFMYVRSNRKTIEFFKFWFNAHDLFPGKPLQGVLAEIKFHSIVDREGLQMRFLDTTHFGGLCEPKNNLDLAITMHITCCVGMYSKILNMKLIIDDWKRYKRNSTIRTWSLRRPCGNL